MGKYKAFFPYTLILIFKEKNSRIMYVLYWISLVMAVWFCGLLKLTIPLTQEFQNIWCKKVTVVKCLSGLGVETAYPGLKSQLHYLLLTCDSRHIS